MSQNVPILSYPLLLLGMVAAPCILVNVVMLPLYGIVDLQNPKDLLGTVVSGFLAAVMLGVTVRAFVKTLNGRGTGANTFLEGLALSAPLWWVVGAVGGAVFAHKIHEDRIVFMQEYTESICSEVLEQGTDAFTACLKIAEKCDDEADQGPCGKANLKSQEAGKICTDKTHERIAALREDERVLLANPESNYTRVWRQMCVLEGVREHR